jgi:hypothetical protein
MRATVRVICQKCERPVVAGNLGRHTRACGVPKDQRMREPHTFCPTHPDRLMKMGGECCWLCEEKDPYMKHLDALVKETCA